MTIACGLSAQDADALARSLGAPVPVLPDVATVLRKIRTALDETLMVLGPDLPDPQALRVGAQARAARPGTVIVLLRPAANRLDRELARRAGIDAILPAGDLDAAGARCREFLAAHLAVPRGRVVTVFGGKGGCGRTTIAVNLAVVLAAATTDRVCLVDLDLRSGDVAVTLGLEPLRTLASAAPDDVDALVTPLRDRLDCVLAPVGPGEAERIEADGVEATLTAL